MEIQAGGGVFGLGNPVGRGHSDPGNLGGSGGQKTLPSVGGGGGGGWIFSGITQCKYIFWLFKDRLIIHDRAPLSNCEISLKKKKISGLHSFHRKPPNFFSG